MAFAEGLNRGVASVERICAARSSSRAASTTRSRPRRSARKVAWEAKGRSELREYPCGHFGYLLELRDRVIEDQLHFLRRHLAPGTASTT